MAEIGGTLDPFVEAEIREHYAAPIREIVAIVTIIYVMWIVVGLH